MVSGWATGKTMCAIIKAVNLSLKYPNNLGVILRKNYIDLKDSTLADYETYTKRTVKKGDKSVVYDYVDLKGMYDNTPEEKRDGMSFEQFEKMIREAPKPEGEDEKAPEGFDYKILGSEVKDDVTIVKVKVKENEDAEWEEHEVLFKKIDGKWKITAEGIEKLGALQ